MKKVIIGLFALMLSSSYVRAQESEVLSAFEYLQVYNYEKKSGNMSVALENLRMAKEAIDKATVHEKTISKSKTWKRKVEVYLKLLTEKDPSLNPLKTNILDEIYTAITKARTVEVNEKSGQPKIYDKEGLEQSMLYFSDTLSKVGGVSFSAGDYKNAISYFEKRYDLLKAIGYTDTATYTNIFLAAYRGQDTDKALSIGTELMKWNYDDPSLYGTMAQIYQKKGEKEKGLEIIKDARKRFPEKTEFITEELNYYLTDNDNDNAVRVMNEAIEAYKNDQEMLKQLYFNSGVIFSNLKDMAQSRAYYEKALAIDPTHFGSLNNLASIYLGEANDIVTKANLLPISEQKKYDEMTAKAKETYKKAGELLEKAYDLKMADLEKAKTPQEKQAAASNIGKLKSVLYEIFSKLDDEARIEKYKE